MRHAGWKLAACRLRISRHRVAHRKAGRWGTAMLDMEMAEREGNLDKQRRQAKPGATPLP